MKSVVLADAADFDGWRKAARALVLAEVPPEAVRWSVAGEGADLFDGEEITPHDAPAFAVPRGFIDLARTVICHSDPERFALLHALLCRVTAAPAALEDHADPLLRRLEEMAKAVRRDMHKMRAFVRFREVGDPDGAFRFVAWFEPDHHIVRANAGFFVRRFGSMRWSILTPEVSLHWDGKTLSESPGATRADAPSGDPIEATWRAYYAAIFNPARLKVKAMLKEMPKKYWRNMPETALVPGLVAGARAREIAMIEKASTQERPQMPAGDNAQASWEALRAEAMGCTRCDLHRCATQTIFGEGPLDARLMFVGEQPGDKEDLAGRAFVGPAGQLLDRALAEAGIDRERAYVTNAVKHFKFEKRGKRRIHARPNGGEIRACRWWLDAERTIVRPDIVVALGATAAQALFGKAVTLSGLRGAPHPLLDGGGEAWVTVHPSFLLRVREDKDAEYERFVADLVRIGERMKDFA